MSESTVLTEEEKKAKDEKKEPSIGEEVRTKSFQQLLEEDKKESSQQEQSPTHSEEENKKAQEEARLAKEAEDAKRVVESDEAEKNRVEEVARKAAEEVITKQQAEEEAKQKALKDAEEAKQHEQALKPKFTGVDEKGNIVPKDYEEIANEASRIAEEKAIRKIRLENEEKASKEKVAMEERARGEQQRKDAEKAYNDQLQRELDADLTDLYTNNKLPKITNKDDVNDIGNKEFRNLFETAQRVNAERIAKGELPIRSLKLIYYEHYKPLGKPAGDNAPVIGAESSLSHDAPEDKYIPSRDRGKSWDQMVKEEVTRLTKKLNVRNA